MNDKAHRFGVVLVRVTRRPARWTDRYNRTGRTGRWSRARLPGARIRMIRAQTSGSSAGSHSAAESMNIPGWR
jgi:hypothetical protein